MEENGAHFFEGTEKLLEVWFTRQDEAKGTGDLRTIPRWVTGPPGRGGGTCHHAVSAGDPLWTHRL